ncbi:MAG: sulfatase-like hydrolase/transferase [Proteobacteria bacterium]|nr:sulfatase-like hydrolase/transferase [Pseudomonadota bacterium]
MKIKIALALIGVTGLGTLLSQHWFDGPALAADADDPTTDDQPFYWQSGPDRADIDRATRPPNIILILADDLGFNDITFYGGGIAGGSVPTPNIDSIAREGIHFPRAYAGNATCAPSRAALLTGRYPTRVGFEFTPTSPGFARRSPGFLIDNARNYPPASALGLPAEELTLPELLKQKGYHSMALGKWHLGTTAGSIPNDQGFDEFLGFLGGAQLYLDEDDPNVVNSKQEFDPIDRFLWANLGFNVRFNQGDAFSPPSHMTDYLSREAVKAIEANRNRPFFMYLAYNAPHTPLQAEKADYDALSHIEDHTERTYAAMLRGLDRGIGQVLTALQENGLEENTIVIFTSDNGGAGYVGIPDLNKPYRGWKITFFEGGIHVPYFIKWPRQIPAGSRYDSPVAHIDVFATVLAAAGIDLPDDRIIDGVDILASALQAEPPELTRPLFWRDGGYKVVQFDGWKLQIQEQNGKQWLFNLNQDPTEQVNLSGIAPDRVQLLRRILYELDDQMAEPLWPSLTESTIPVDYTINNLPDGDYETILWTN